MELPFEVLDYIFFLLRSDPETLVKCSKVHSLFPQIVNKHLFYHIVIHLAHLNLSTIVLSRPGFGYNLSVSELIKLVSETPQLVDHVRVLEIDFFDPHTYLEDLAAVLPAFSSLESITLMAWHVIVWANILSWSPSFKTAIKGCLHLPTMRELHIGDFEFPLSLLCTNSNINSLSLSGSSLIPDSSDHAFPQLNSLSIKHLRCSSLQSLSPWIKRHITDLQSLKCDSTDEDFILELLDTCSNTLRNLDIDLKTALRELGLPNSRYIKVFSTETGQVLTCNASPSINLTSLFLSLPRLHHFTIRTDTYSAAGCFFTTLAAAVDILKPITSLRHLTVEIVIDRIEETLFKVDFARFVTLLESSLTVHRIELYVFSFQDPDCRRVADLLAEYRVIGDLAERGVLVVHDQETAPWIH